MAKSASQQNQFSMKEVALNACGQVAIPTVAEAV